MFQNDFKTFIDERLNETVSTLRKSNKSYQDKYEEYEKIYDQLVSTLKPTQVTLLESLIDAQNYMTSDELVSLYVTAFKDTLTLTNDRFISNLP